MAKKLTPCVPPYEALANAIIIDACNDYRILLKKVKKNPKDKASLEEALKIERFFRSEWYEVLTDVDGEYLIRKLREDIRQSA